MFGGARFPSVGPDGSISVTLGSRDFFWLLVSRPDDREAAAPLAGMPASVRPAPEEPAETAGTTAEQEEPVTPAKPSAESPAARPETYVVPTSTSAPRAKSSGCPNARPSGTSRRSSTETFGPT